MTPTEHLILRRALCTIPYRVLERLEPEDWQAICQVFLSLKWWRPREYR